MKRVSAPNFRFLWRLLIMLNSSKQLPPICNLRRAASLATTVVVLLVGIFIGTGLVLGTLYASGSLPGKTETLTLPPITSVVTQTSTLATGTTTVSMVKSTYVFTETTTQTTVVTSLSSTPTVGSGQVVVVLASVPHTLSTAGLAAGCAMVQGTNGYIYVQDNGAVSTAIDSITFSYGGGTFTIGLSPAGCSIQGSGGGIYVTISSLNPGIPAAGEAFSGSLGLTNGPSLSFTGTFS